MDYALRLQTILAAVHGGFNLSVIRSSNVIMNLGAHNRSRRQQGYVLLVLLLFVALLSIGLLGMVERFDFQIRRDREEELIHRGVQYSRAVRKFVKKFGRYPENIEELEDTNNIRFLRKRYADPVTGKAFKILHVNELQTFRPIDPPSADVDASQQDASQLPNVKAAGSAHPDPRAITDSQNVQDNGQNDALLSDQGVSTGTVMLASPQPVPRRLSPNSAARLTGGPMVGVASISEQKTIREFNKKTHYNEWQFVYDPTTDNLASITGPNQPLLKKALAPDQPDRPQSPNGIGANLGQVNPPAGLADQPANQP